MHTRRLLGPCFAPCCALRTWPGGTVYSGSGDLLRGPFQHVDGSAAYGAAVRMGQGTGSGVVLDGIPKTPFKGKIR